MPSVLERIVRHKREEVEARRAARPHLDCRGCPAPRDFAAALRGDRVRLIAEIKRASPSRGVIREEFDPEELAGCFAAGGAACLSVLTDERFFQGSDRILTRLRETTRLPLLRKDFLIDPWQIAESRALGADAVLLIAAVLPPARLREFQQRAHDLGMSALVETHTEEELLAALELDAPLIGINNRNLHTFQTDLEITERLAPLALRSGERILVSESGIFTAADVERAARAGACAVLVGEGLVREPQMDAVAARVRELAGVTRPRGTG